MSLSMPSKLILLNYSVFQCRTLPSNFPVHIDSTSRTTFHSRYITLEYFAPQKMTTRHWDQYQLMSIYKWVTKQQLSNLKIENPSRTSRQVERLGKKVVLIFFSICPTPLVITFFNNIRSTFVFLFCYLTISRTFPVNQQEGQMFRE